jgi:hypothetical protein
MAKQQAETVNMEAFLGIGIQLHLKNSDWAIYFKPEKLITAGDDRNEDRWVGHDDEGLETIARRKEIDFIVYR